MQCHQILASFYPWFLLHFFPLLLFLATGSRELSNSSRFPTKNHPLNYQKKLWSHPIIPSWYICQLEAPDSKPKVSNLPSAGSLEPPRTQLEDVPETAGKKCQKSLDWGDNFGVHFKVPIHGKKYIDLIFTCIRIRLISNAIFQPYFEMISFILFQGFSGCCLDSIKRPYLGMRGFCFIIQANTSPACSINWNTSQVERDSASATELVMRTRPRAYSFDSYPCTGRPDVPERLQRMTPHSSWNRASQISFRIELIHLIQLPFSEVSEINYTSQSTLLSLLEDVWPVPLIDQRPWSSPVQSQVKNVYGGSVKYVFVQTSHFDILNFLRIETFEPCHSSSITTM